MRRSPLWLVATLLAAGCEQPAEPNMQATAESLEPPRIQLSAPS